MPGSGHPNDGRRGGVDAGESTQRPASDIREADPSEFMEPQAERPTIPVPEDASDEEILAIARKVFDEAVERGDVALQDETRTIIEVLSCPPQPDEFIFEEIHITDEQRREIQQRADELARERGFGDIGPKS
jgi:hypothetical protein